MNQILNRRSCLGLNVITLMAALAISISGFAQTTQWRVWQKINPCQDTRQDWYTVAENNPGGLGSPNVWQFAEGPFSTFTAAADAAKMNTQKYGSACCKDWGVLRNVNTGTLSAARIAVDNPVPFGFEVVPTGPMCCEDAFARAGLAAGSIRDCRNLQLSAPAVMPRPVPAR